jgi:hypothetical protein
MKLWLLPLLAAPLFAQSAIEGTVASSTTAAPIPGVNVRIRQGDKSIASTTTSPDGAYRVDPLAPGIYVVSFSSDGFVIHRESAAVSAAPLRLDVRLIPYASISGRVLDPAGKPVPKANVQLLGMTRPQGRDDSADDHGAFTFRNVEPGVYRLSARPPGDYPAPEAPADSPRTWARVYYPGTDRAEAAASLTIAPAADLFGYELALHSVRARRVRGRVLDAKGDPVPGASVTLIPEGELTLNELELQTGTDENGGFDFGRASDGSWKLEVARADPKATAAVRLRIAADIDRFEIRLKPSFTVSGSVLRDKPAAGALDIMLIPPGGGSHIFGAQTDPSGAFHIDDVIEGSYAMVVLPVKPPYYLASIRLGERDVLGETFEVHSGAPPLTVALKSDSGIVRGFVEDCNGATVLIAPQDPRIPDFTKTTVCRAGGAFEIAALAPGEYYAYAFAEAPGALELGRLALAPLTNSAVRVTVRANEATRVDLKITRP